MTSSGAAGSLSLTFVTRPDPSQLVQRENLRPLIGSSNLAAVLARTPRERPIQGQDYVHRPAGTPV
ncbi:hypothetical protein FAIPA1_150041 [Frankia sp. AiPs1]